MYTRINMNCMSVSSCDRNSPFKKPLYISPRLPMATANKNFESFTRPLALEHTQQKTPKAHFGLASRLLPNTKRQITEYINLYDDIIYGGPGEYYSKKNLTWNCAESFPSRINSAAAPLAPVPHTRFCWTSTNTFAPGRSWRNGVWRSLKFEVTCTIIHLRFILSLWI